MAELLDVFAKLMPNPAEGNPPPFYKGEGAEAVEIRAEPDPKKHVLAHVFKIVIDPFVGKLAAFRVFQGTIRRDSQLFIGDGRKPFKVGHLFLLQGKDHIETDACVPGDIAAVTKVDEIELDAVLHDSHDEDHIHLKPMQYPVPMHALALELKRRGDEQRLSEVLHKLAAEDPCFRIDHSGNETVIRGLGDLHMRYILDKMQKQYHVEVATKPPRIPYRETVTAKAEGHHRHKKQTGGAGQFGEVFLRIEPLARGKGFEFVDQVKGGTIPTPVHPGGRKRRARSAYSGAARRLSAAGRARDRLRRQAPPGRFEGSRVRRRRQESVSRRDPESAGHRARAHRQHRDQCAGGQHGRHRRRHLGETRPDQRHAKRDRQAW